MKQRITRRIFAQTGAAATLGLTSLETTHAMGSPEPGTAARTPANILEIRPYQLMCIVCRIGEGKTEELGDARLTEILAAARAAPKIPIRLRLNTDSVYDYQNPCVGQARFE